MSDNSAYERWVTSDPFIPGVEYVLVYSLGAFLAGLDPEIAMFGLMVYIIFAVGARFSAVKNE